MRTPGPGDEATWPSYAGHPNDPRAPDTESDGLDEFTPDELLAFARHADDQRDMLLKALKAALIPYLKGECYETKNPYCRPYVKQGLVAVAKTEGKSCFGTDWMDAIDTAQNMLHDDHYKGKFDAPV